MQKPKSTRPAKTRTEPSQSAKFSQLARELECDESEEAFKAKLVKVAKAPRVPGPKRD